MQSLEISAQEAAEAGRLPSITTDIRLNAYVAAPNSSELRTFATGSVGHRLAAMILSQHVTKIQAYTGPAQYGAERLRAWPDATVYSKRIQLGLDPDTDLHGIDEDETEIPAARSQTMGGTWDLSAGVQNLAISINVEISRDDVHDEHRADYDALREATVGALNFRTHDPQALLGAILCPSAPTGGTDGNARNALLGADCERTVSLEEANRPYFLLDGILSGHIDLSEGEDVNDVLKKVDIPCRARVFFTSPTAEDAVPGLASDDEDMSSDGE